MPKTIEGKESPLEGKFVITEYQSHAGDEEINTVLIYKIASGKAEQIFGVLDFPPYQGGSYEDFMKSVLEIVDKYKIKEVFELTGHKNDFGIKFFDEDLDLN